MVRTYNLFNIETEPGGISRQKDKTMEFVNLTPHSLVIRTATGDTTVAPSGQVARVTQQPGEAFSLPELPGVQLQAAPRFGELEGLPEPQPGVIYLVSGLCASRAFGRADVFAPGTGPQDGAIRDGDGRVVAVTRLNQAPLA